MRLDSGQRANIEVGRAMLGVSADGAEYYIEDVMDVYGQPSEKHKGCVYAFDADGDAVGGMYPSLDACKEALGIV